MQAWMDERMDALEQKVDDGFAEMRTEFKAVRTEFSTAIGEVRSEARADFRTLIAVMLSMSVAMILGFAGIILSQV
jgi:hypothetical protein